MKKVKKKNNLKLKREIILVLLVLLIIISAFVVFKSVTSNNNKTEKVTETTKKKEPKKKKEEKVKEFDPLVAENKKSVENSYFDDACFIGNSRSEGLKVYGGLDNASFYTEVGMNVETAMQQPTIYIEGQMMMLSDALGLKQFGKVYIMLGINEINWPYPEVFIEKYAALINMVKEKQPNAIIYVESMMPVGASNSSGIANDNVKQKNEMIKQMCKDNKWYYIDMFSTIAGSDGCLPVEYSDEGIHMNTEGCKKWVEVLKKYTVNK